MDSLARIVKEVVFSYASSGLNLRTYPLANEEQGIYAVNVVDWPIHQQSASVVVLARIEGDQVIVEEDATDRSLVDALIKAGIARSNIVAYSAEDETRNSTLNQS